MRIVMAGALVVAAGCTLGARLGWRIADTAKTCPPVHLPPDGRRAVDRRRPQPRQAAAVLIRNTPKHAAPPGPSPLAAG